MRITVTDRNRRAICSVRSVQLSAITTIRSGTLDWPSSAVSIAAMEASSSCAGISTTILAARRRGGRYRTSCTTRDTARRTSPTRALARISAGSRPGPGHCAGATPALMILPVLGAMTSSLVAMTVPPRSSR